MEQMWLSSTKSFNHIDLWKEKKMDEGVSKGALNELAPTLVPC
jgi:hypothetical protein